MLTNDLFSGVVPFVQTASEQSFSRAAATLGVTTAAVSKAIHRLETELGVRLLERTSRVVTLTREGEVFLDRCRTAVLSVQGGREAMQSSRREPAGELAVTLPFILAPFVVPHLPELSAKCPRLTFRMNLTDRVARVADESFDVAVRMGELPDSSLVSRLLRRTRWTTVAAPAYLARARPPKSPAELTEHNCLRFLGPNGKARPWTFASSDGPHLLPVAGNLLIDHGSHLLSAAEAGLGICQVLDFMVQPSLRSGALVELLAERAAAGPNIFALSTPGRVRSVNVRALLTFLTDVFQR